MKLGIVGTSYISHIFAQSAASAGFTIGGVLSRIKTVARSFYHIMAAAWFMLPLRKWRQIARLM